MSNDHGARLELRLQELKRERVNGLEMKQNLERRLAELDATLLRIDGAIRVLEETLEDQQ